MTYSALSMTTPQPRTNAGVPTLLIGPAAYLGMAFIYFSVSASSPLRDPLYLLPWLIMAELLVRGRMTFRPFVLAVGLVLLAWLATSALQNPNEFAMRETLFVVSSILVTLPRYRVPRAFPRLLVVASAAVCAVIFMGGASRNELGYVSEFTRGIAESEFGLIVPVASLLLYLRRDWMWLAASVVISYAMYKRIALAALAVAILVDLVARLATGRIHPLIARTLAAAFVATSCLISLNSVAFFEFAASAWSAIVGYAVDPNELTSGRYNATQVFWREVLGGTDAMQWIFGHGIGTSTHAFAVLGNLRLHNFPLLHNDWLRVLTDLGLVGVTSMSAGLLWAFSRGGLVLLIAIYSTILLMTDNIAGYFIYWAGVVMIVRSTGTR